MASSRGTIYFAARGLVRAGEADPSASVVAYDDLGPEALYALEIVAFPAVVIIDRAGRNFHETARAQWRRS
jgi:fumarate hydratase subunit beta